jgi:hypothetical protein
MKVLLVEPNYRRSTPKDPSPEESKWYPPLGLMKIARFHIERGDEVVLAHGCDETKIPKMDLFSTEELWDRVYITTLFTFHFNKIVETINNYKYKAVGVTASKIFVGGIMSSLMADDIIEETGIYPNIGVLASSENQLGLTDIEGHDINIDGLVPYYDLFEPELYAISDTYYGYASRGCINKCAWCGVPTLEPKFVPYIDLKENIRELRKEYGDKRYLKLMDNNIMASEHLNQIVQDLIDLGYGKENHDQRGLSRYIDFNQGLDASYFNEETIRILEKLNIQPMRIAFDRLQEKEIYTNAILLANEHGFNEFSNYLLYNFHDTPRDLYDRLVINIKLNEQFIEKSEKETRSGKIYSYPMRYAPIKDQGEHENRSRDRIFPIPESVDWAVAPAWTKRFIRNIEIMRGVAHGAISPTPSLAWRTVGHTFDEFVSNLYMPEEFLRKRNKHEKRTYDFNDSQSAGTGLIEEFRKFISDILGKQDSDRFIFFHNAVTQNSIPAINDALKNTQDKELVKWLRFYIVK